VNVFLESFSPKYKLCYDFVISIAEPKSRQEFIHYYEINPSSLNAAITLGLTTDEIISQLSAFNKMQYIPRRVEEHIRKTTSSFGKAKLVLKENRYFIEAEDKGVVEFYKGMKNLEDCWLGESVYNIGGLVEEELDYYDEFSTLPGTTFSRAGMNEEVQTLDKLLRIKEKDNFIEKYEQMIQEAERNDEPVEKKIIYRLEINPQKIDKVKKERTLMSNEDKFKYMLTQEYDYKRETKENPMLDFRLKTHVKIRPYQEKALSRMFVEGRARSGIIVLPCGAGKTLVGIIAMSRVKRRTLILCINNITVKQWEKQALDFSTLPQNKIFKFISESKEEAVPDLTQSCVVISTYTMISRSDEGRSAFSKEFIERLGQVEWGLLILDEVQVAPAEVFKKAFLTKTKSHCKLGLTATLVREDNKIEDLQFYIGPKLYEESWKDLTNQGFLARVQCVEIRVTMSDEFMKEYKAKGDFGRNKGMYLYTGNPNKFFAIQYLIKMHVAHGDKILVFIDSIDILMHFAKILGYPFISGDLKNFERERLLQFFQTLPKWNVLFVSRVGDVGIDLPDANVAIEVSSQFGSRRQEAQRLGRILRPKENKEGKYQSYFYSLVSIGTDEVKYAIKRQKFLVKQGYSFKIIQEEVLPYNKNPKEKRKFKMSRVEDQQQFLNQLLSQSLSKDTRKDNIEEMEEVKPNIRRRVVNNQAGTMYAERDTN
jgi:DNA excision repair protein ERCC-3